MNWPNLTCHGILAKCPRYFFAIGLLGDSGDVFYWPFGSRHPVIFVCL